MRSIVAIAAVAAISSSAHAGQIFHTDISAGVNNYFLNVGGVGVTVTSSGGNFIHKFDHGSSAMGVLGGSVFDEIDGDEFVLFTFDTPVNITSLTISYLYLAGHYSDIWNEIAAFDTSAGNFTFEVTGPATGNWTGFGSYVNESPPVLDSGGQWRFFGSNIFGGPITTLLLRSGNPGPKLGYADFGFRMLEFTPVPSPGALALLGIACLTVRRRRG